MRPFSRFFVPPTSLPAKLTMVVVIFVLAIGVVRISSVDRLAHIDLLSAEIRNRWLDSIRILGTLSQRISDVRRAEAEIMLNRDPASRAARLNDLQRYLDAVTRGLDRYRLVPHDPDETLAFDTFLNHWIEHVSDARAIAAFARDGGAGIDPEAAVIRLDESARTSFDPADIDLLHLTSLTETKAEAARNVAAHTIILAQRWISDLLLATLALVVALALFLWSSVSRPLLRLAGLMQRLASHDTNFVVPSEHRRDEIGAMARALAVFRSNTIELLESRKSLAAHAEVLAGLLDKERSLVAEQQNFITTTSHEFRTPLASIDGHAQRLLATSERASPSSIVERATKIRAAVFRMTSLVASLTEAMDAKQAPPNSTLRFDFAGMLRGFCVITGTSAPGHLDRAYRRLRGGIVGSPTLLHQAFSNLISNALKYSPDGSTITLEAEARDGWVEVAVTDSGCGIPVDEIAHVRERFYRGSNVGSIPGTGVGLHLVDQIVRGHGGCLRIESEIDRGTRITVVLPINGPGQAATEEHGEQNPVRGGRPRDGESAGGSAYGTGLHDRSCVRWRTGA